MGLEQTIPGGNDSLGCLKDLFVDIRRKESASLGRWVPTKVRQEVGMRLACRLGSIPLEIISNLEFIHTSFPVIYCTFTAWKVPDSRLVWKPGTGLVPKELYIEKQIGKWSIRKKILVGRW